MKRTTPSRALHRAPYNERSKPFESFLLNTPGLDLLASAVVLLDAEGNTLRLNPAGERLFGVTDAAMAGRPFSGLFSNGAIIDGLVEEACNEPFGHQSMHMRLERPGMATLYLQTEVVALESALAALLIEMRPVGRPEEPTEALRGEAGRDLVRNLAHEIRNPLGGIRGAAQLLDSELPTAVLREYTQVIIKEADRLQTLVDRLLAPHSNPASLSPTNIHEVLERVRSLVLAEYPQGLRISRDYDASLPELFGDKEQLIQVLLNLVRNAAQSLQGSGEIRLVTRVARWVLVGQHRIKLALDLHVIDNGPGIPAGIRERLFEPLVSGREGGSGLGLSLVRNFVHHHGGSVTVESAHGRTDFRILLPLTGSAG